MAIRRQDDAPVTVHQRIKARLEEVRPTARFGNSTIRLIILVVENMAEVTRKLLIVECNSETLDWFRANLPLKVNESIHQLPSAAELGRVAVKAWQLAGQQAKHWDDAVEATGQAILDALTKPILDDTIPCQFKIGLTTCGYTRAKHFRADGSPMNHRFTTLTKRMEGGDAK